MKLIQILNKWKDIFLTLIHSTDAKKSSLFLLLTITFFACLIWIIGPYLNWDGYFPLASYEKRLYVVCCLFLIWLLKWLTFDLAMLDLPYFKDPNIRKALQSLHQQIRKIIFVLNTNFTTRHGAKISLQALPWVIMLGPRSAGKTSLLANTPLHYLLRPRWQAKTHIKNAASVNCWVNKEMNIIDLPGHFFAGSGSTPLPIFPADAWRFLLRLIKKYRGKAGLNGILIIIPCPDLLAGGKNFLAVLKNLTLRLQELQHIFVNPIPCYIILTKCDVIPGFKEFFAELHEEETTQPWGINLSNTENIKLHTVFIERFNLLIKKLNKQLLTRLHQERNPFTKPIIKDFPLQMEKLKEPLYELIKKLCNLTLPIQGIYLTSAVQPEKNHIHHLKEVHTEQKSMQIFQEPTYKNRAYFSKKILLHSFVLNKIPLHKDKKYLWVKRISYTAACCAAAIITLLLSKDLNRGLFNSYSIQNELSKHELAIVNSTSVVELFRHTTTFLDILNQGKITQSTAIDLANILSFYSNKSQQKIAYAYQHALQTLLLVEIRNYFESYLLKGSNNNEETYSVFKAYLMLADREHFHADTIFFIFTQISTQLAGTSFYPHLLQHLQKALLAWRPMLLNASIINSVRNYFFNLSDLQRSYIILKNINDNNQISKINLGKINKKGTVLIGEEDINQIANMFMGSTFSNIISHESTEAATDALIGNWILGSNIQRAHHLLPALTEQLRITYLNHYIETWETLLHNIKLAAPDNLQEADTIINELISSNSSLLRLLTTIHDNTYFEPIVSSSPKLQKIGFIFDSRYQPNALYRLFSSLQNLHLYLLSIITAEDERKAAFEAVAARMQETNNKDAITQLRFAAEQYPQPVKTWLNEIANYTWHYLMQDAARYIDISWQEKVSRIYQNEIANRYPFIVNSKREVELQKFADFFGKPGVIVNFHQRYLHAFIDTSNQNWHWKTHDSLKLPFSEDSLRRIQQALQIHQIFFPNNGDKPYVRFALKLYKLNKHIQNISLNINDQGVIDDPSNHKNAHLIIWPAAQKATLAIKIANDKSVNREYSGDWGWFKFINQSFEGALTKKGILLNLSKNEYPAHYLLFTNHNFNPFLAMNLQYFRLPSTLIEQAT